eukprot:SRR837773.17093.p2 GENE.SRR837773.17093~~SRR837773.17093.p2  ORF type:complete len:178 (-),score=35.80 SRR837773.17093:4-480(-)
MSSCKTAGVAGAVDSSCTGTGCCQQSSCLSNSFPGVKCDGSRGQTTCVGASVFSMKEGVCQCKVGACSPQGQCSDAPPGGVASVAPTAAWAQSTIGDWETQRSQAVPRETPFRGMLFYGLGCAALTTLVSVVSRRRGAARAQRDALLSEAQEEEVCAE